MIKIANTPSELMDNIDEALMQFLQTDFRDYLEETEVRMIDKYVYSYKPTDYALHERRKTHGGLSDRNNMDMRILPNEGACIFYNNTPSQEVDYRNADLSEAEAVEVGDAAWHMDNSESNHGPGPRPFMQETVNYLASKRGTYTIFRRYFNGNTIQIK